MDLFEGLDGLGPGKKKQSLAEQRASKQREMENAIDILSGGSAPQKPQQQQDDDIFGLFSSAPPIKPTPAAPSKPVVPVAPVKLAETAKPVPPARQPAPELPIRPNQQPKPASKPTPNFSNADNSRWDPKVAQLVDMGFEAPDATRALRAMNGDVRGSVSWLMAEAQGLPLPTPRADLHTTASLIGASVFSKASSLFAKGKRELEKAYMQYSGERPAWNSEAKPAWMAETPRSSVSNSSQRYTDSFHDNPRSSAREPEEKVLSAPKEVQRDPERRVRRADLFRKARESRTQTASTEQPTVSTTKVSSSEPAIDLLNLNSAETESASLSATQTDLYKASLDLGRDSFRRGSYEEAAEHFSSALQIVSAPTPLRALLLSNRCAALLKSGDAQGAFADSQQALKLIPNRGDSLMVEGTNMRDVWVKLVTRQAQSAEMLERFELALNAWKLLLENGHASPQALEAKRRCINALNPEAQRKAEQSQPKKQSNRRGWGTDGAKPTSAAGKEALEKVKRSHEEQRREEEERDALRHTIEQKIDGWKKGNEQNLRVLLSTLHTVLWDGCAWTPVASSELVVPKKVRIYYMRAVARTHPDKLPAGSSTEVKMIAQSVFVVIQQAWEQFKTENSL